MIPQSCDTMVALKNTTQHNQTIFAKNSDRPADECQPLELHPRKTHPPGTQTQCQFVTLPEVEALSDRAAVSAIASAASMTSLAVSLMVTSPVPSDPATEPFTVLPTSPVNAEKLFDALNVQVPYWSGSG